MKSVVNVKGTVFFILITGLLLLGCQPRSKTGVEFSADVIVYGGTSAAVIAAVEVVQSGKSVIMVSPDVHLGGLSAGGLGWSDTGKKEAIGGLSRVFYQKIYHNPLKYNIFL